MSILVTGSTGHLGEGLVRTLRDRGTEAIGLDLKPGPFTTHTGSLTDPELVRAAVDGVDAVIHTATLHKPHVVTHGRQAFVDTNVTGTLQLLEAAVASGVGSFVFTSTTSVFGRATQPSPGEPTTWIDEGVAPVPRNIYGATKLAAETLCELVHREQRLPCLILRTSRFFPEEDDRRSVRETYSDENTKANEYLYRRVDLQDAVDAHLLAVELASELGFDRFIISATTPFARADLVDLRKAAPAVVARLFPEYERLYGVRGWRMLPGLDRVYVNARARRHLGWRPRLDFGEILARLARGEDLRSPLARRVGAKGYHGETFDEGPYPVTETPG